MDQNKKCNIKKTICKSLKCYKYLKKLSSVYNLQNISHNSLKNNLNQENVSNINILINQNKDPTITEYKNTPVQTENVMKTKEVNNEIIKKQSMTRNKNISSHVNLETSVKSKQALGTTCKLSTRKIVNQHVLIDKTPKSKISIYKENIGYTLTKKNLKKIKEKMLRENVTSSSNGKVTRAQNRTKMAYNNKRFVKQRNILTDLSKETVLLGIPKTVIVNKSSKVKKAMSIGKKIRHNCSNESYEHNSIGGTHISFDQLATYDARTKFKNFGIYDPNNSTLVIEEQKLIDENSLHYSLESTTDQQLINEFDMVKPRQESKRLFYDNVLVTNDKINLSSVREQKNRKYDEISEVSKLNILDQMPSTSAQRKVFSSISTGIILPEYLPRIKTSCESRTEAAELTKETFPDVAEIKEALAECVITPAESAKTTKLKTISSSKGFNVIPTSSKSVATSNDFKIKTTDKSKTSDHIKEIISDEVGKELTSPKLLGASNGYTEEALTITNGSSPHQISERENLSRTSCAAIKEATVDIDNEKQYKMQGNTINYDNNSLEYDQTNSVPLIHDINYQINIQDSIHITQTLDYYQLPTHGLNTELNNFGIYNNSDIPNISKEASFEEEKDSLNQIGKLITSVEMELSETPESICVTPLIYNKATFCYPSEKTLNEIQHIDKVYNDFDLSSVGNKEITSIKSHQLDLSSIDKASLNYENMAYSYNTKNAGSTPFRLKESKSNLEKNSNDEAWTKKIINNQIVYIHSKSGMSSFIEPFTTSDVQFLKRNPFVPKGSSPNQYYNIDCAPNFIIERDDDLFENYDNSRINTSLFHYPKNYINLNNPNSGSISIVFNKENLDNMNILGQIDKKFIPAIDLKNNLLVIFDQHAVSERILLEKILMKNRDGNNLNKFNLNYKFEINFHENTILTMNKYSENFSKIGFTFSCTYGTVIFESIPKFLDRYQNFDLIIICKDLIVSLVNEFEEDMVNGTGITLPYPKSIMKIICNQACRNAIKFGDKLNLNECKNLVKDLVMCHLPFQCAHGRPSIVPVCMLDDDNDKRTFDQPNYNRFK